MSADDRAVEIRAVCRAASLHDQWPELTEALIQSPLSVSEVRRFVLLVNGLADSATWTAPTMPDLSPFDGDWLPADLRARGRQIVAIMVDRMAPQRDTTTTH